MKRALPWIVLVVLAAVCFLPALLYVTDGDAEAVSEPTRITRYNAVFDIDDRGDMTVTETLIVDFPGGDRHGIFRFFDEYDRNDARAPRVPRRIAVSRDGRPEEFERLREQQGRLHVVKVGDPDVTVPAGEHSYVLRYEVEDVLLDRGDGSRFYWDLVPGGWAQPIDEAVLTVRLPQAPRGDVRCAVGAGEADNCRARVTGSTVTVEAEGLAPRTPVTIRSDLEMSAPTAQSHLAWPVFLAPALGRWSWLLAVVALASLGAGWLGRRIAAPMLERPPAFPLQYAPPPGIGPAQAAYVLTERTPRRVFVASLMHAAERGTVSLERGDSAWTVTRLPGSLQVALDPVTRHLTARLHADADRFVAAKGDVDAGRTLQEARTTLEKDVKEWALREGLVTKAGLGSLAGVGVVGALVLSGLLVVTLNAHMALVAMVPGAFAAMGLPVLYPGATTKRTDTGRQMWAQVGGFRRVLATPSSVERFDFSGRRELFTAYLPWAVAFGCAKEWAQKYRLETASEPPDPLWLVGVPHASGRGVESMVDDFSSTLDSAVSSYQATQSDSGSGGGGFSGGGGGGGGGGGSW